ncbi:MAG: SUMF1/EgtB/PvdO family nonheme iron enzyme [Chitinophagales bacterium]
MPNQSTAVKIFIAYSRLDEAYLKELKKYLRSLSRKKNVQIWYDGEIVPGTQWETQINQKLQEANIILLLISANSLHSDYFHGKEMLKALERHEKGEAMVIPIILSYCTWTMEEELNALQALPKDGKPISAWMDKSEAYTNIALEVNRSVGLIREIEKKKQQEQIRLEAEKKGIEKFQNLLELANTQFQIEDWQAAKSSYKEAAKHKNTSLIQERIAAIDQTLKDTQEQARLEAEKKVALQKESDYQELLQLANTQFQKQERVAAKKSYQKAAKYKDTPQIQERIAAIDQALKDIQKQARLEAEKQATLQKDEEYQTLLQLANTQYQTEEWKAAKSSYEKAAKYKSTPQIKKRITLVSRKLSEIASQKKVAALPPLLQQLVDDMVVVKGGTFTMGCASFFGLGCKSSEKPIHEVKLKQFKIGKYLVTHEQWMVVMGKEPSAPAKRELERKKRFESGPLKDLGEMYDLNKRIRQDCKNCPVVDASWNETQEFIKKLNQLTGKQFRLPREAEWEFAAKGGNKSQGFKYAGSNKLDEVAWYDNNSSGRTVRPVGSKRANELGLYDMSGNVWERCQDWYSEDYYKNSPVQNPKGPKKGSSRVLRSGTYAEVCRVSSRSNTNPIYSSLRNTGFRLVEDF